MNVALEKYLNNVHKSAVYAETKTGKRFREQLPLVIQTLQSLHDSTVALGGRLTDIDPRWLHFRRILKDFDENKLLMQEFFAAFLEAKPLRGVEVTMVDIKHILVCWCDIINRMQKIVSRAPTMCRLDIRYKKDLTGTFMVAQDFQIKTH